MDDRDRNDQRDRARGNQYQSVNASGNSRLQAGSNYYNDSYSTNYSINLQLPGNPYGQQYSQSYAQQYGQPYGQLSQPYPQPYGQRLRSPQIQQDSSDEQNASTPSQNSDATSNEYNSGPGRRGGGPSSAAESPTPSYQIIKYARREDSRFTYFLDGQGLARDVVLKEVGDMAGPHAAVGRRTYKGREGYLIVGNLLDQDQILELKQKSQEHEARMKLDAILRNPI